MVDAIAKYEAIQMERDADNIEKGREAGLQEGREEERQLAEKKTRKTIQQLAKMELSPAQIAQAVDWPEAEIRKILTTK